MEKQWYRVAPGVTRVNGARVSEGQRLHLTRSEALFDLGLERIALYGVEAEGEIDPPPTRRRTPRAAVSDDGGV